MTSQNHSNKMTRSTLIRPGFSIDLLTLRQITFVLLAAIFMITGTKTPLVQAGELPPPEHAYIHFHTTVSKIVPGQPFTVIIEQLIEPNWHTYWKNPGDSGTPTNVKWTLPDGSQAGPLEYPFPSRIATGPLMSFGFSNRALFSTTITPSPHLTGDQFTMTADIDWLVCHDICLPEGETITMTLPIATDGQATVNQNVTNLLSDLTTNHPVKTDWSATYRDEGDQVVIAFTPSEAAENILENGGKIEFYPTEWGVIENAAEQVLVLTDQSEHLITIRKGDRNRQDIGTFTAIFVVKDAQGNAQGYESPVVPYQQKGDSLPSNSPADTQTSSTAPLPVATAGGTSLIGALLFAFLGGLILNLMPCVFPVLSLKILSIAQLSKNDAKHMRPHGLAYGAGVVTTFLLIAGLLMILQQGGAAIGWGFQLQQPVIIASLAYLFFIMGLNLIGVFEIDIARFIPTRFQNHQDGLVGSFATGILATIVATPCTAPFMGAALAYALTHHPLIGLIVFTALGIGLALPFVALTFMPHLHRYLPRPGAWMLNFRQALAFPMFMATLWLIWVLGHQTGVDGIGLALIGLLTFGLILWLWRLKPTTKIWRLICRLAILTALITFIWATHAQNRLESSDVSSTTSHDNVQSYHPEILSQALATPHPVFVNMTAAWCITCKLNEQVAIKTQTIQNLFREKEMIYIKGDWTNYNAEITDYLNQFDRKGVPLYVYYGAPDEKGQRPQPVILPQLLTPALLASTFNQP